MRNIAITLAAIIAIVISGICGAHIRRYYNDTADVRQQIEDLRHEAAEYYGITLKRGQKLGFYKHTTVSEEHKEDLGCYIEVYSEPTFMHEFGYGTLYDDDEGFTTRFLELQSTIEEPTSVTLAKIFIALTVIVAVLGALFGLCEYLDRRTAYKRVVRDSCDHIRWLN